MQTTLFEVIFLDGRIFRVFCRGKNQIKRFISTTNKLKSEIKNIIEVSNAIHDISQFEQMV